MSFSPAMTITIALRAKYRCEICGKDVSKVEPGQISSSFEAHSMYGAHLKKTKDCGPNEYVATSMPKGYKRKSGESNIVYAYLILDDRADDGVCLCKECHDRVHLEAMRDTKFKYPDYQYDWADHELLAELTRCCILRGGFD